MSILRRLLGRFGLSASSLSSRFSRIYEQHAWSGGGAETRSGAGSTIVATEQIRSQLPRLLREYQATGLMDIGCGDFNWMKEVELPVPYLGLDIVDSMISSNSAKYGTNAIRFACLDATREPLPAGYDFAICREVLFHLSFRDCKRLLRNVLSSEARFLMLTTSRKIATNKDIVSGGFRNLNLEAPPFNFPKPQEFVEDNSISEDRILGLWRTEDLPTV